MKREQKFRTVKETSEYLGVPLRTVYRLVSEGKIKSIRIGGTIKCLSGDVDKCANCGTDPDEAKVKVEATGSDRRKHERINTSVASLYSVDLKPFKNIKGEGIIKNLSEGGVFLVFENQNGEVVQGDPVDVSFILDKKEITVKGRVIRIEKEGVAIKFRFMSRKSNITIKEYVG